MAPWPVCRRRCSCSPPRPWSPGWCCSTPCSVGASTRSAARGRRQSAGFPIRRIQLFIYSFVGVLSGIAGLTYGSLNRQANPFDIVGSELDVIAAVVLGGAQITGGRGSVVGTLLGVFLVVIMNNSLILAGIPSVWQKVVIGVIIIIGTGIPAFQQRRAERRARIALAE